MIVDIDNNNQNVSSGGHDSGVTLLCWNSDGSNLFAGHSVNIFLRFIDLLIRHLRVPLTQ